MSYEIPLTCDVRSAAAKGAEQRKAAEGSKAVHYFTTQSIITRSDSYKRGGRLGRGRLDIFTAHPLARCLSDAVPDAFCGVGGV